MGAEFTVQDPAWVISVYADGNALYAGVSRPEENLSGWNGGAIRFRKEDGQISRAKFKLMEAEKEFAIPFTASVMRLILAPLQGLDFFLAGAWNEGNSG